MKQPRNVVRIVRGLIQQLDIAAVGQHTPSILVVQHRANVLGNGCQNCAPLAGTAGKLEVVVRAGAVAQQELEFIGKNPSAASQHAVSGDAVPNLIQYRHHADGLHTLAQFHGVKADAVVLQIHVRLVGKQVHCAVHIHLQCRSKILSVCALQKKVAVEVVQCRHLFALWVQKILLVSQQRCLVDRIAFLRR